MLRPNLLRALVLALGAGGLVAAVRLGAETVSQAGVLALTHPGDRSEPGSGGAPEGNGAAAARAVDASANRASGSSTAAPELQAWSELRADATRLLGRRVRFAVQFHGRVERWNSYLSRFGPRDYSAFQFWTDEQLPWRTEDFEAPVVRLFARHDTGAEAALQRATRYARFEIEGTLRELFLGEPWIEAECVRPLPEGLTEGSVIHGGRALTLMDDGMWKLAESELDIALQARVPARSREELERLRQVCRENSTAASGRPARPSARPWTGPAPNVRVPRRRDPDD